MLQELLTAAAAVSAGVLYVASAARVVKQYERGVVLRLGRLAGEVREPGFTMVVPFVDGCKVNMLSETPAALQLRLLQTVVAVAAEKNSTLVLPFPVVLLRFLEAAQKAQGRPGGTRERPVERRDRPVER
ncbi:hypothetical protein [Streptomyces mutabilis]|uniref:Band 7 domain-containing protein n=1 Tax=Streptomyces mutabilis TaxID=67332 RepID=A0A086MW50_9ACTN|nr:hypothetical protein [Streptomyces mutabilis]KFG73118.1 hypothetical protein FM21_19970 [Streptomyces mutabilis]